MGLAGHGGCDALLLQGLHVLAEEVEDRDKVQDADVVVREARATIHEDERHVDDVCEGSKVREQVAEDLEATTMLTGDPGSGAADDQGRVVPLVLVRKVDRATT